MSRQKLLSFNKENQDVLDMINSKSNASQYICEAIRFYERNKDFMKEMSRIEEKIDEINNKLDNGDVKMDCEVTEPPIKQSIEIDSDIRNSILGEDD